MEISSAGVGRTGVFIALYYLMEAFERRHMLNVKQLVDTIRLYRPHLVQTVVCTISSFLGGKTDPIRNYRIRFFT